MSRPVSTVRIAALVAAVAVVWASVATLVHGTVVLPLSLSLLNQLEPPAWWISSRIPWPASFLDAAIFALVAAAFSWACARFGVSRSHALLGVMAGTAGIWIWLVGQMLYVSWALGVPGVFALVRSDAPVNISGSVGAAIGAFLASGVLLGLSGRGAIRSRVRASA